MPEDVGDETGDEQQEPRDEQEPTVDEVSARHTAGVELVADPAQRAGALALHDPGPDDRDRQEQGDHLAHADPLGDLHHHRDLGDGDDHEGGEQDEHRPEFYPPPRVPVRPRARAS